MTAMFDLLERLLGSRAVTRTAAALLPLVTCALLSTVKDEVTVATSALVLVLLVVAASASGDRLTGLVAALSGGAWFDFFLTEPFHRFAVSDPDDVEVVVLLLVIGVAVNEVALWGYRQKAAAARRTGYLEGVLGAADVVASGAISTDALVSAVSGQISDVLGAGGCRYVAGPVGTVRVVIERDGTVVRAGQPIDVDRRGLPVDDDTVVLVQHGGTVLGQFVVTAASRTAYPSVEQRRVAVLLADQVAAALVHRQVTP